MYINSCFASARNCGTCFSSEGINGRVLSRTLFLILIHFWSRIFAEQSALDDWNSHVVNYFERLFALINGKKISTLSERVSRGFSRWHNQQFHALYNTVFTFSRRWPEWGTDNLIFWMDFPERKTITIVQFFTRWWAMCESSGKQWKRRNFLDNWWFSMKWHRINPRCEWVMVNWVGKDRKINESEDVE